MASVSYSSVNLCDKASPFCSGFNKPLFNSFSIGVGSAKKNRGFRVSVCKASAAAAFPNLDADDFRHPLDKQVTDRILLF